MLKLASGKGTLAGCRRPSFLLGQLVQNGISCTCLGELASSRAAPVKRWWNSLLPHTDHSGPGGRRGGGGCGGRRHQDGPRNMAQVKSNLGLVAPSPVANDPQPPPTPTGRKPLAVSNGQHKPHLFYSRGPTCLLSSFQESDMFRPDPRSNVISCCNWKMTFSGM